jgi:hypothetical protein
MASKKKAAELIGAKAVGSEADDEKLTQPKSDRKATTKAPAAPVQSTDQPKLTKREQLIKLLSVKHGIDLASISAAFGWLPHTTRAALSGLRKAGHAVQTEKGECGKPTRYRITIVPVAGPTQADVPAPDVGAA